MIVLDTNVISELMRPGADVHVISWADVHPRDELYLTAVTAAELRLGVTRMPEGRRKAELASYVEGVVAEDFAGRILPFDHEAADHYAQIVAQRGARGDPISQSDAQIAAICRSNGAILATRNTKDFAHTGVFLRNPWDAFKSDRAWPNGIGKPPRSV